MCVHDWDGFGRLLEAGAPNVLENVKGSAATARRAAQLIKELKPNFLFIHFDDVDHAGHEFGWKSPEYFRAVEDIRRHQLLAQGGKIIRPVRTLGADRDVWVQIEPGQLDQFRGDCGTDSLGRLQGQCHGLVCGFALPQAAGNADDLDRSCRGLGGIPGEVRVFRVRD